MTSARLQEFARRRIPDLYRPVAITEDEALAIRRPRHPFDKGGLPVVARHRRTRRARKDRHGAVLSTARHILAVWGPGDGKGVAVDDLAPVLDAGARVPDLHGPIVTRRSDAYAVWGPGERDDRRAALPSIGQQRRRIDRPWGAKGCWTRGGRRSRSRLARGSGAAGCQQRQGGDGHQ